MPSFDIVSQVNSMEIENAVNQARKELANRFDFKGVNAEIVLEKNEIKLSAPDAFKIKALEEMVIEGIDTTIPLHLRILKDPAFLKGDIHTGYLDEFLSLEHAEK